MKKILVVLFIVAPLYASAMEAEFPALTGPVVDTTGVLRTNQVKGLAEKSLLLQREKGAQVAICIVNTTSPLPIEDYGIRLAEKWKIGRAGVDDGVIIIVALQDRKMRIEVGYGLEPVITDLKAGRIIDLIMAPEFRKSNYYDGINMAMDAIAELVRGGEPAAFREYDAAMAQADSDLFTFSQKAGMVVLTAGILAFIVFMALSRLLISLAVMYLSLFGGIYLLDNAPAGEAAMLALWALVPFIIMGVIAKFTSGTTGSYSGSDSYSSRSSYSSYSSSSYSSGSSSSSSYSGGGGSFGGGGASGSW